MSDLRDSVLRAMPEGLKRAIDQLLEHGVSATHVRFFIGALVDNSNPKEASLVHSLVQLYLEDK
jgi:phosphoribulokinase